MTAFFRAQRGIESEVEDSFTIILQYGGPQKDLLVTVKTAVTSPVAEQLKFYVRGTKGSYIKVCMTPADRRTTPTLTNPPSTNNAAPALRRNRSRQAPSPSTRDSASSRMTCAAC